MRLVPSYQPRPSPLHAARAGVTTSFCAALALVPMLYDSPLVLAGGLAAATLAGIAAGVGAELARAARASSAPTPAAIPAATQAARPPASTSGLS